MAKETVKPRGFETPMAPSRAGSKKKRMRKPRGFRGKLGLQHAGYLRADHGSAPGSPKVVWLGITPKDARRLIKWLEAYVAWAEERE